MIGLRKPDALRTVCLHCQEVSPLFSNRPLGRAKRTVWEAQHGVNCLHEKTSIPGSVSPDRERVPVGV